MEKDQRIVSLTMLTLTMYGIVNVFVGKPFAFFPINEIVFFAIILVLAVRNFNRAPFSYIFFLLAGFLDLVANQFFIELFFGHQKLNFFLGPKDQFLFHVIAYIFLIFEMFHANQRINRKLNWYFFPVVLIFLLLYLIFKRYTFVVAALASFVIPLFISSKNQLGTRGIYTMDLIMIWGLFFFLELTKLISIYLYDIQF